MRKIDEIILHCSATEAGKDVRADDIRQWHVVGKRWRDIGYHFVVDLDGTIEAGRPIDQAGAHVTGHNATTIGICYVGGLLNGKPSDTRTTAQRRAIGELVTALSMVFPTIKKISGHRDYANKACPCFEAQQYKNCLNHGRP